MNKLFFQIFKARTENTWEVLRYDKKRYGYQIQKDTKWLLGHTYNEVKTVFNLAKVDPEFQNQDLIDLLLFTKGLSLPQINMNPIEQEKKFVNNWKLNVEYIQKVWNIDDEQEHLKYLYEIIPKEHVILPIFAHRFIVITKDDLKVYSVYNDDIIIYGYDLQEYLEKEFLDKR